MKKALTSIKERLAFMHLLPLSSGKAVRAKAKPNAEPRQRPPTTQTPKDGPRTAAPPAAPVRSSVAPLGPDRAEDDPADEMRGSSALAAARRRERARCAAILRSEFAEGRRALAAHLAFNTAMTRSEAIAFLKTCPAAAAPAPSPAAHLGRAARNPNLSACAPPAGSRSQQLAGMWDRAFQANQRAGRRPAADDTPRRR